MHTNAYEWVKSPVMLLTDAVSMDKLSQAGTCRTAFHIWLGFYPTENAITLLPEDKLFEPCHLLDDIHKKRIRVSLQ